LELALGEDPKTLAALEEKDSFFLELHRTSLRVAGWALWHRAMRDPSRRGDLERSERYLRQAYDLPIIFPAFPHPPGLLALLPVLLAEEKLEEAEQYLVEFEVFRATWQELKKSAMDVGHDMYEATWSETFEARGDLELRRRHYEEAARAFERAAADGNTR